MFYQLVVLCCICIVWRIWFKKRWTSPPKLSGSLPIVGHAFMVLGDSVKLYKTIKKFSDECLEKGGVATIELGPRRIYVMADPEDCLTLLNSCLQKNYYYQFMKPLFGNGLILADEITWKNHRKLLNPAFKQKVLDGFLGIFNTQARRLVDQFGTELGKPFDHEELLKISNLETICLTIAGVDSNEYSNLQKQYLSRLENVIKRCNKRIQRVWLHSDFIYNMTHEKKIQDEDLMYIKELSKSIIEKKKSDKKNLTKTVHKGKCKGFIDLMLDLASDSGCFTDDEIQDETDNIILGGHETTASLLTYALTVLGSNTAVQEKAYKEILHVIGNSEKRIHTDDLSKLVYIESVIKETLRYYPIIAFFGRRLDTHVKLRNYTLKANSDCFISIYGLNRHKIWGPDADQFRPERWLEKETLPDPKYFGAFGMGRRACIGKVFAMMSMKITLAHVLQKYHITSDISKMVEMYEITAKPFSGHYITLALRNI